MNELYRQQGTYLCDEDCQRIIPWLYKRCRKSEEVHSIKKDNLAGVKPASDYFGANAAWWRIMIFALNLNAFIKDLVLCELLFPKRMNVIRFSLINIPALIVECSCEVCVRLP